MGEFSFTHLLLLGIIALIFFGPSRLPALGKSLGQAIKGFKSGLRETEVEVNSAMLERDALATRSQAPQQLTAATAAQPASAQATTAQTAETRQI
jgi:sec-independent protein translocase protein TatA